MKINDIFVADYNFAESEELSDDVKNLEFPQKYLLLEIGNEVVSLDIMEVTHTAVYLKINEDGTVGKV